jgi:hypothetical protein
LVTHTIYEDLYKKNNWSITARIMKIRSSNRVAPSTKIKSTIVITTVAAIAITGIIATLAFIYFNLGKSESALAAGSSYTSGTSGSWTSGPTWLGGVAPPVTNLNDDLITVKSNHSIQRTGNISIQNNTTFTIESNAVLTINGDLNIQNNFTLNCAGTLIVTGKLITQNGASITINGGGNFQVNGDVTLGNGADITVDGNFTIGGSFSMGTNSTFDGTGNVSVSGSGCSNWSGPGSCGSGPLPVKLLSFSAKDNGDETVTITWETASEKNNDYFTIQQSTDGITYQEIGTVRGNGTSKDRLKYTYTDYNPAGGRSYYRLEQTDYDGTKEAFSPIAINVISKESMGAFPNPLTGRKLTVSLPHPEAGTLSILDHSGNAVHHQAVTGTSKDVVINLSTDLAPGQYYLHYKTKSSSQSLKLSKE